MGQRDAKAPAAAPGFGQAGQKVAVPEQAGQGIRSGAGHGAGGIFHVFFAPFRAAPRVFVGEQRQHVAGFQRPGRVAKGEDFPHGFGLADLQEHNFPLVQGTPGRRALFRPHGKVLSFPPAHAVPQADKHAGQGQKRADVAALLQQAAVGHDAGRRGSGRSVAVGFAAERSGLGHVRRQFGLVQKDGGVLVHVSQTFPVHVLRVEGVAGMNPHADAASAQRIGQADVVHGLKDCLSEAFALGSGGFGQKCGQGIVAGPGGEGFFREICGEGRGQIRDQAFGKGVARLPRHVAQAAEAHGHEAHASHMGEGVLAAVVIAAERGADERRLAQQAFAQRLAGGQPGQGVGPGVFVQGKVVDAERDHAGKRGEQGRHERRIGPAGHEDPEQLAVAAQGDEQFFFLGQPFRAVRSRVLREVNGMAFKGDDPEQAVAQAFFALKQVASDQMTAAGAGGRDGGFGRNAVRGRKGRAHGRSFIRVRGYQREQSAGR